MWQQNQKVHNNTEPDPQGQCGQRKVSCPYRAGMGSDEQKTGKTVDNQKVGSFVTDMACKFTYVDYTVCVC